MIEIRDDRYYVALWQIQAEPGDWLACLWRENDRPYDWHLQYRLRYRQDTVVWGSDDFKFWGELLFREETEEDAVSQTHQLLQSVTGNPDYLASTTQFLVRNQGSRLNELLRTNSVPWLHVREDPPY